MEPDHRPVSENIISLTLEIVFLLTGEDYKVVGKSSEFANKGILGPKGACSAKMPTLSSRSVMADKKVLEVSNKIIHLLTGEVWRFLGHAAVFDDVVKENLQTVNSPGSSEVFYNKMTRATIKQEPILFEEGDLPRADISEPSDDTEATGRLTEKTIAPRLGRSPNNVEGHTQTQSTSKLKAEPQVREEENICKSPAV
ncbi:PREDICTED: oocyte zinc finger protein XlCOF29-like [Nanorana parkeri]|uniref:oocyte zinc finger protein XlCOF29-like n=1 Tax=Nanorana parkeri TaxID=125878 RepID=UPI000854456A|nr:PREDICTED: oocyte zinc finger protein XlCOF29-like [Nanorana parkeri]